MDTHNKQPDCGTAQTLVERNFEVAEGHLLIDGLAVTDLADRYGTPLYLYDGGILQRNWQRLRAALPEQLSVYYSMKANPNQRLLNFFLRRGCGIEIASVGELQQALAAGCPAERVVYAGPGKTRADLQVACAQGVAEIHVESLGEIRRLAEALQQSGGKARVAIRVNPDSQAAGGAMRMGGQATAFGVDEEQLHGVVERVEREPALQLTGIHVYAGTQLLDHETLLRQMRRAVEIGQRVATWIDRSLQTIDFGGGLGIPYFPHETPLDLDQLAIGLKNLVADISQRPLLKDTRLLLEPGRYLVGEAGLYITRVVDVKSSRGQKFVVVDGGMHHHLAASGNLGQVIKRNFPVAVVNRLNETPCEAVNVAGCLCTPLDVLARGLPVPAVAEGDLLGVFQAGAYARSASPLGFLSHVTPPEVLVSRGRDMLIRRRGKPDHYLHDQVNPALLDDQPGQAVGGHHG